MHHLEEKRDELYVKLGQVCRSAMLAGSCSAWSMASSQMVRCRLTRQLAAATTLSTRCLGDEGWPIFACGDSIWAYVCARKFQKMVLVSGCCFFGVSASNRLIGN